MGLRDWGEHMILEKEVNELKKIFLSISEKSK
jgi:hypothetical protein